MESFDIRSKAVVCSTKQKINELWINIFNKYKCTDQELADGASPQQEEDKSRYVITPDLGLDLVLARQNVP